MSNALPIALAALAGGAVSGTVVTLVQRPAPATAPTGADLVQRDAADLAAIARDLQAAVETLEARITALELAPTAAPRVAAGPADAVTQADLDALREELSSQQLPTSASLGSPRMKEQLAEAVRDVQREQTVAKYESRQEEERSSIDERVEKMTEFLDLDANQSERMREELLEKSNRDMEVLRQWAEGVDGSVLGETKRQNDQDHRAAMEGILRPDQLERFRRATERRGGK
ncbi:MAG: hypothetical protein AAGB93_04835 [Planctomycetota bacterium]